MTIFDINRNYVNDLISARDFKQFILYRSNQVYYDPSKEFFEMFKTVLNEKYKTKKTDMKSCIPEKRKVSYLPCLPLRQRFLLFFPPCRNSQDHRVLDSF